MEGRSAGDSQGRGEDDTGRGWKGELRREGSQ